MVKVRSRQQVFGGAIFSQWDEDSENCVSATLGETRGKSWSVWSMNVQDSGARVWDRTATQGVSVGGSLTAAPSLPL